MDKTKIATFEGKNIRRVWNVQKEKWYFSVVDVIQILTNSSIPRRYWSDLKVNLSEEGSEVYENIVQLKMLSADNKMRLTDTVDMETMFRIIQSIPSPKAEPFKLWLAKVGHERVEEIYDPERSVNRARGNWQQLGRSEKWIQQRMMGQETRNKLTDYWSGHGIEKQNEYAILTNIIHREWSDLSVERHKKIKGLKTENLRDHMTEAEIIFSALAEFSTRQIAETEEAEGMNKNSSACIKGGKIAKKARKELEQKTGKKIVSSENFNVPEIEADGRMTSLR